VGDKDFEGHFARTDQMERVSAVTLFPQIFSLPEFTGLGDFRQPLDYGRLQAHDKWVTAQALLGKAFAQADFPRSFEQTKDMVQFVFQLRFCPTCCNIAPPGRW